jgi:hypothetical protein
MRSQKLGYGRQTFVRFLSPLLEHLEPITSFAKASIHGGSIYASAPEDRLGCRVDLGSGVYCVTESLPVQLQALVHALSSTEGLGELKLYSHLLKCRI